MERFGKLRQLVYSSGSIGFSIMDNIFGIYLIFFLLPPKETGLPELVSNTPLFFGVTVVGMIIFFGRVVDSIADPLIAHWSDNSKSRLGRRKFFMVTGALPFALCTALLFFPPDSAPSNLNVLYIAIVLGLYFFFYTYFMAPYLALIPELSHTHQDRINIIVYQAIFLLFGAVIVMLIAPVLMQRLEQAALTKALALKAAIVIMTVVGFLFMFLSTLVIDEKKYTVNTPANVRLFESIKMTLQNRTFIIYMISAMLYYFSFHIIRAIIAYYPMVLLHKDQSFQTILMAALFGSAVICFVLISLAAKKLTNKSLMMTGLFCFIFLMSFTYFIDLLGDYKVLGGYIHMALLGLPVAIILVIPNAVVSDICEIDGHKTGKNREAMFFGTQGLFGKVTFGLAAIIVSYLFAEFGKDVANPMGVKLAGPVAGLFSLIGFIVFSFYPQKSISSQLEKIRAGK